MQRRDGPLGMVADVFAHFIIPQILFHITPVRIRELVSEKTEKWPGNLKLLAELK